PVGDAPPRGRILKRERGLVARAPAHVEREVGGNRPALRGDREVEHRRGHARAVDAGVGASLPVAALPLASWAVTRGEGGGGERGEERTRSEGKATKHVAHDSRITTSRAPFREAKRPMKGVCQPHRREGESAT